MWIVSVSISVFLVTDAAVLTCSRRPVGILLPGALDGQGLGDWRSNSAVDSGVTNAVSQKRVVITDTSFRSGRGNLHTGLQRAALAGHGACSVPHGTRGVLDIGSDSFLDSQGIQQM